MKLIVSDDSIQFGKGDSNIVLEYDTEDAIWCTTSIAELKLTRSLLWVAVEYVGAMISHETFGDPAMDDDP